MILEYHFDRSSVHRLDDFPLVGGDDGTPCRRIRPCLGLKGKHGESIDDGVVELMKARLPEDTTRAGRLCVAKPGRT